MELADAARLAHELMIRHGLNGWTFAFNNAKRQLGVCKYARKRIELAAFYTQNNSDESVRDTILHEIAHALAGHAAGHGPEWQAIAARIGATPERCNTEPDTVVHPGLWQTTCSACGHTYHRHQRPIPGRGYRCRCSAKTPLTFRFQGDPQFEPPKAEHEPCWHAKCPNCPIVYRRVRQPKDGHWYCRCAKNSLLTWEYGVPPQT